MKKSRHNEVKVDAVK